MPVISDAPDRLPATMARRFAASPAAFKASIWPTNDAGAAPGTEAINAWRPRSFSSPIASSAELQAPSPSPSANRVQPEILSPRRGAGGGGGGNVDGGSWGWLRRWLGHRLWLRRFLLAASSAEIVAGGVQVLLRVDAIVGPLACRDPGVQVVEEADHEADLAAEVLDVAGLVVGVAERVTRVEGHDATRSQSLGQVRESVVGGLAALGGLHVLARLAVLVAGCLLAKRGGLGPGEGPRRHGCADDERRRRRGCG
jgi:hypothetical protein